MTSSTNDDDEPCGAVALLPDVDLSPEASRVAAEAARSRVRRLRWVGRREVDFIEDDPPRTDAA